MISMSINEVKQKAEELYSETDLKELLDAAVFYGLKKTKTYPRMRQYILTTRTDFEIINLKKTTDKMEEAKDFLIKTLKEGGNVLFVGTQPAAFKIKEIAESVNMPAVLNKWVGGLLTNFNVISKRIDFYKKLKNDMESGSLDKYTKKEKVKIQRQLDKLQKLFDGLLNFNELPRVLVVIDPVAHSTAIREANRMKIPVIALINTDGNPDLVTIPVPGNTKASTSINWFLNKIKEYIEEARKMNSGINSLDQESVAK